MNTLFGIIQKKTLLAHRIFWQPQLVDVFIRTDGYCQIIKSNLTSNKVAQWSPYYIMAMLTWILIQRDVFSIDITSIYCQIKALSKM